MPKQIERPSRRAFLLTVGAGGAAGAAAIAGKRASSSAGTEKSRAVSSGYHASEHVNNYYRTTKV